MGNLGAADIDGRWEEQFTNGILRFQEQITEYDVISFQTDKICGNLPFLGD